MKTLLCVLLLFFSYPLFSQVQVENDKIIMSQDKHDQLKKNIIDYKKLINEHTILKKKQVEILQENERLKNKIDSLSKEIDNLNVELKNCQKKKNPFKAFLNFFKNIKFKKSTPYKEKQDW